MTRYLRFLVWLPQVGKRHGLVGLLQVGVKLVKIVLTSGRAMYKLYKSWENRLKAGFVKVLSQQRLLLVFQLLGNGMEKGESSADVSVRWDINSSIDYNRKLTGQKEGFTHHRVSLKNFLNVLMSAHIT